MAEANNCHCGAALAYEDCCGRFIQGLALATTAESLMRSRYSAYVVMDEPYLLQTWHPDTRPSRVRLDPTQRWLGLTIKATKAGLEQDDRGTVEFVARVKTGGKAQRLHEISRFERLGGAWFYRDGEYPSGKAP